VFRKSIFKLNNLFFLITKFLKFVFQIDLENYDTRLIELDTCGESERTVFIMPPEMNDLPFDNLYTYEVKYNNIYY